MPIPELRLEDRAKDVTASILFLTRLPFARDTPIGGADIARAAWAFPIAGVVVGLIGALVYMIAHRAGLPAWPAAALAVAATVAVTGCLHEDGLADTADGFGGGSTRNQKLDIMRDSRIGAYGVCALTLTIVLRTSALANLADGAAVVAALIAAHGAARATLPAFMYLVPPARDEGLSHEIGRPSIESVAIAGALAVVMLALCLGVGLGFLALVLLIVVIALMAWLSLAQIGGQTGDVLGALEQVSEIIVLLVALR
jgi:adenosylcobinamide-GDP ribazoletransferase